MQAPLSCLEPNAIIQIDAFGHFRPYDVVSLVVVTLKLRAP